ncbi:MAG: hypothetical protein LBI10_12580 [Deltaproteobacteria bacterium]|nr:hypothetical protein [Deltaproteobacteria bacterium]
MTLSAKALAAPDKSLYQSTPFISSFKAVPHILLVISKDLKMFQQAYNELSDMDGDGRIDTGFNPSVNYYGYFDSYSCYDYNGRVNREGDATGYFSRVGPTKEDFSQADLDHMRDIAIGSSRVIAARSNSGYCNKPHYSQSGYFSGNWLNYLVTSRMDVVRKILYGGYRVVDDPFETLLEPSLVPRDANSWGAEVMSDDRWLKETPMSNYYDISRYTPFPKPVSKTAHFFARVRNTAGRGTYQVFECLLNANQKSFASGTQITGEQGRYFDWVLQDGPNPSTNRLREKNKILAYGLKIKVCAKGNVGFGEDCRQYPKGSLKPVGLLQKNGESGEMFFGLLSGSYDNVTRVQGGVLRNHIGHIREAVDIDNFGQIRKDGLIWNFDTFRISGGVEGTGLQAYRDSTSWGNPIGEMLFEGVRYMARQAQDKKKAPMNPTPIFVPNKETNYNPTNRAFYHKSWDYLPRLSSAECAKPIILLISEVDSEFDGDSAVDEPNDLKMELADGMPATSANYLPNFNLFSYLKLITNLEKFDNGRGYFYARNKFDQCLPKTLSSLIEVNGICPYRPSYEGGYSSAAVAYYAHTHNFGFGDRNMPLDVYTVTMSPAFPSLDFELKKNGKVFKKISILPASMSDTSAKNSKGRILSFLNYYILEWWADQNGLPYHVKFKVNYEDSAQGYNPDFGIWPRSDWDMDIMMEHTIDLLTTSSAYRKPTLINFANMPEASGALKARRLGYYEFREQGNAPFVINPSEVAGLSIRSYKVNNSTSEKMALGYSISGSTHDGTYMDVGHCGGIDTYATPPTCDWPAGYGVNSFMDRGTNCKKRFSSCPGWHRPDPIKNSVVRTFEFSADPSVAGEYLPNPVFLAAKYGGFKDSNHNGIPDVGEWEGPDGLPHNYFQSTNINELPIKLEAAFSSISQSQSASSSTQNAVNSTLGAGVTVLSAFYPNYVSPKNAFNSVKFVGTVYGLFVDKFGNLREDTNQNHRLELKSPLGTTLGDFVVTFNSVRSTPDIKPKCYAKSGQISLCADENGDGALTLVSGSQKAPKNIHGLKTVFDAGRWISELTDVSRRNVYYVDGLNKNTVEPLKDDLNTAIALKDVLLHDNFRDILPSPEGISVSLNKEEMALRLIRFTRGEEIPNWRSRTIWSPWNDKQKIVWRHGDVVNSKPVIVGQPAFNYDLLYRDKSYAAYKTTQATRRRVVYYGSNDGFLKAVNLGYYGSMAGGEVFLDPGGYDLGQELWALIPWSVMPHLQWLADPNYVHSYYVDLKPVVADVKIDGQWRTILICGLRLGGRPIESGAAPSQTPANFYSEIMALDVTDPNPKLPPKVLWRFSAPEMGLSVGLPAVVTSGGRWYVVVASGPAMDRPDPKTGHLVFGNYSPYEGYSDQNARLIVLDAATGQALTSLNDPKLTIPEKNSFFNSPYAPLPLNRSKNGSWHDETVYYGFTVSRDKGAIDLGGVYRLRMVDDKGDPLPVHQWSVKLLASVDRPVTGPVNSALDGSGNLWVIFGTGRLWSLEDITPCSKINTKQCKDNHEHYLFGIKEELKDGRMTFASRDISKLADLSEAQVYKNGLVVYFPPRGGVNLGIGNGALYQNLVKALRQPSVFGYKRKLNLTKLLMKSKETIEMVLSQPQITSVGNDKSILAFTSYELTEQSCGDYGRGFMYVLDTFTGLPAPSLAQSFRPKTGSLGPGLIAGGVSTGFGQPTGAIIMNVDGKIVVRSSTSENSVYDVEVPSDNRNIKNLIAWREVLNTGLSLPLDVMTDKINLKP